MAATTLVSPPLSRDNSADHARAMPRALPGRRVEKTPSGGNPMSNIIPVPDPLARSAWLDEAGYDRMYADSLRDPGKFWGEEGKRLHWTKPYTRVKNTSFTGDVNIRWYEDGTLNASYNCIDRHLATRADQTAIIWEGDSPEVQRHISYAELHENVCRLANVLKSRGV
jgi:acetyl-CoA synthetase